jgi:tRNA uridine 5-carboxymethylaminomethyl modification enzyme
MRAELEKTEIVLQEDEVASLRKAGDRFEVDFASGRNVTASKVVVTTGTFARGKLFRGEEIWDGGRVGEAPAASISDALVSFGLVLRRLKTGTPARLRRDSIDWNLSEEQPGDQNPWAFSSLTESVRNRISCHIVRTTEETHARLREGFARSPLFSGAITGTGPRYCPSIEDKVSRFADRDSHQLFLEPEGLGNDRVYVNGFSSSLPADIQDAALRTIPALANCEVIRYGYAVEYDAIDGTALHPTLEVRHVQGLYLAGQTCGTSGYEEAAAQGLVAGANAALAVAGKGPFLLDRATSYMGVLVDDLTSMPLVEPYRLFTSRAEHRLHLRHDNAEDRLTPKGRELGLVDSIRWDRYCARTEYKTRLKNWLTEIAVDPMRIQSFLETRGESIPESPVRLMQIAKRPHVQLADLVEEMQGEVAGPLDRLACQSLESEIRYEGFFKREERDIERVKRMSGHALPADIDWLAAEGVSVEARQALHAQRPLTVGQAARLPGVRSADVAVLLLYIHSATGLGEKEGG